VDLFAPGHLIPLLIIAGLLFFGWKQLPDMARSAGRSLRVFRTEVKGLADDDAARATNSALTAASTADTPPVIPPAPAAPATTPATAAEDITAPDPSGKPAG
jgi:sec-independent protein translocase protein TatA